jgi:hypothetical protein
MDDVLHVHGLSLVVVAGRYGRVSAGANDWGILTGLLSLDAVSPTHVDYWEFRGSPVSGILSVWRFC